MSVNTRIAKAYVILITTSVIGHILSLFKEVMVAKYFGISNLMDAFYAALALPNLITGVIASAFGLVFLPIFVKYKTVNKEEGNRIAAIAVNYISLLLALTSVLLFIFAKQCVHYIFPGLDGNTAVITVKILKILSVTVFFTGIIGISTWILNAYEHFFAPSFSQIFITISILAFLFLFVDKLGVYVFAWGTVAGLAVQLVFILPFMKKEGYRHYWDFNLNHPAIEQAVKLSFFLVILNFISGLTPLINRIMASWLPTGSIAALAYADKLVQVPLIIFSGSIATAIYPFFAKQLAENKIDDMRDTLATSIKMTGFIFIPMAIILMILAKPIIQVLFQRGVFDEQATSITARIFVFYALQLFSNYALVVMIRLMFVFQDMKSIFKISVITVILNAVLNLVFMKLISPPAAGIALASSITCLLSAVLYFVYLKKRIHNLHGLAIIRSLFNTAMLGIISGITVFIAYEYISVLVTNRFILTRLLIICGAVIPGVAVFGLLSVIFRVEEAEKIYVLIKNKMQSVLKFGKINNL